MTAAEVFYRHFSNCRVCHFGITYRSDRLCEVGKEIQHDLLLALSDEQYEREELHAMERYVETVGADNVATLIPGRAVR